MSATAIGGKDAESHLQDNFAATLDFSDGSVATIVYTSRGDTGVGKERVEVFAGGVTCIIEDFERAEVWRDGKRDVWKGRQDKGHRAQLEAFVEAVRTGAPSPIALQELALSSLTTLRAADALGSGRKVRVGWTKAP